MYTWPALLTSPSETPRERYGRRRRWGAAPHKMPITDRQSLVAPLRRRPAPAGTNKHTLAEPNWRGARKIFQMAPSLPSLASLSYANTDNKYFWSDHNKIHIFCPKRQVYIAPNLALTDIPVHFYLSLPHSDVPFGFRPSHKCHSGFAKFEYLLIFRPRPTLTTNFGLW